MCWRTHTNRASGALPKRLGWLVSDIRLVQMHIPYCLLVSPVRWFVKMPPICCSLQTVASKSRHKETGTPAEPQKPQHSPCCICSRSSCQICLQLRCPCCYHSSYCRREGKVWSVCANHHCDLHQQKACVSPTSRVLGR